MFADLPSHRKTRWHIPTSVFHALAPPHCAASCCRRRCLAHRPAPHRADAAATACRGDRHRHRPPPGSAAGIAGFGDAPLARSAVAGQRRAAAQQLTRRRRARGLADLTRLDAAVSDAYNADGLLGPASRVRGFTLDNRYNYRRDGLPINAETSLPLDNKAARRGAEGHQRHAGRHQCTGRPGEPGRQAPRRHAAPRRLDWRERRHAAAPASTWRSASARQDAFGLRLNAAAEHLDPTVHDADGQRSLLALAGDWRLGARHAARGRVRDQPPVAAQRAGLQPARRPRCRDAERIDPRINLNNQPWSLPVVLDGNTGVAALARSAWRRTGRSPRMPTTQRLRTDDRIAFPYGCSTGGQLRPLLQRRQLRPLRLPQRQRAPHAAMRWTCMPRASCAPAPSPTSSPPARSPRAFASASSRRPTTRDRRHRQRRRQLPIAAADAGRPGPEPNTNRTSAAPSCTLRDACAADGRPRRCGRACATPGWTAPERAAPTAAGATAYSQSFTTPWLAASHAARRATRWSTPAGAGASNRTSCRTAPGYTNAGQALPAHQEPPDRDSASSSAGDRSSWSAGRVRHPPARSSTTSAAAATTPARPAPRRGSTASSHNRGVEADGTLAHGPLALQASAMQWLKARSRGSSDAAVNGQRPTNVPERTPARLQRRYAVAAVPGLTLQARHGRRRRPHGAARQQRRRSPAGPARTWARATSSAPASTTLTWRVGVDNADRPPRMERIALPVRARVPVPAGAAHLARSACRSTCRART